MSDDSRSSHVVDIEAAILRALCSETTTEAARQRAVRDLTGYAWRETDHAVLFQAIAGTSRREGAKWREDLPARTTRMGFPDLDWAIYLKPGRGKRPPLETLISRLKTIAASRE